MIRESFLRWKYQGVWNAKIGGVETKVVISYGGRDVAGPYYNMLAYLRSTVSRSMISARGMGKWLKDHKARRVHR